MKRDKEVMRDIMHHTNSIFMHACLAIAAIGYFFFELTPDQKTICFVIFIGVNVFDCINYWGQVISEKVSK